APGHAGRAAVVSVCHGLGLRGVRPSWPPARSRAIDISAHNVRKAHNAAMQKLPPLNALKAFDAAARHLSFTGAAAELYVTHGAVSRQIAALEQDLKVALFVRGPRGLKLTAEGAQFARGIGTAFDTLRSAVAQVRQEGRAE